MPAAGFGFGDAVIVELLKAKNLMPDVASQVKTQIVVAPLGGEQVR